MRKQLIPILAAASLLAQPSLMLAAPSYVFDAAGASKLDISSFQVETYPVGLSIAPFGSATVNGSVYRFPIVGGAVDSATILLEAVNVGGMKISSSKNVVVLNSPIVNTIPTQPIMTFLVTINGDLQGRYEIFDLAVPAYPKPQKLKAGEKVHAASITVTLSQVGANVLNTALGTSFPAGQQVGTLSVKGVIGEKLP